MTTNVSVDAKLIEKVLQVSGEKTKKETIEKAVQKYIARREQVRLLDLFGKLDWDEGYDYKLDRFRR